MDRPEKTLLLVTYHFPPSAAVAVHRMLGFARYLPRFGWKVIVVAPPHVPHEPEDPALLKQVPPETTVVRVPFPKGLWGRVLGRVAPMGSWLPGAARACARIIRDHAPDALLTSSPPPSVHYLGLYLKKRYGLPWIASLRDPWVTNSDQRDLSRWQKRWHARMEARVFRKADRVVANTPLNLEGFQQAYPRLAHKMTYITNGYDPERFPRAPAPHALGERVTLLHAGELYSGRDPRPLLDVLGDLEKSGIAPRFHLDFLGRSTESMFDLPAEVQSRGLEEVVSSVGQVPYAEAIERMTAADILLLVHSPGFKVGVPAKLYEYLGAGRPVLALAEPDSDIAWVLRASGLPHRVAPPHDRALIQKALLELGQEVVRAEGGVVKPANLEIFTREHMARRLAQCLDTLVPAPHAEVNA